MLLTCCFFVVPQLRAVQFEALLSPYLHILHLCLPLADIIDQPKLSARDSAYKGWTRVDEMVNSQCVRSLNGLVRKPKRQRGSLRLNQEKLILESQMARGTIHIKYFGAMQLLDDNHESETVRRILPGSM